MKIRGYCKIGENYRESERAEGFPFTIWVAGGRPAFSRAVRGGPHCSVGFTLLVTLYFPRCCLQRNTKLSNIIKHI